MKAELEDFFVANTDATYINSDRKRKLVSADNAIRIEQAKEQYKKIQCKLLLLYLM